MPDLYVINIQPHNWETCRENHVYGIRHGAPTPFSRSRWRTGDICLVRVSGPEYGVRAIWCLDSERPVKSGEKVPWTDADYDWIAQFKPLAEFSEPFSEEFEGVSKYSEKIKMNSIRIVQSVVKLTPNETRNYLQPLLEGKRLELEVDVSYLGSKTRLDSLLRGLLKESGAQKILPAEEHKAPLEDIVGEVINFRGIVYAPLNEAGAILLFSKVMDELGLFYESTPARFPDMVGRVRTDRGLERRFIEFEFKSSNFKTHHHPEQMQKGSRCDMIVCWEHDWPDCPIEVIELKSLIKQLGE